MGEAGEWLYALWKVNTNILVENSDLVARFEERKRREEQSDANKRDNEGQDLANHTPAPDQHDEFGLENNYRRGEALMGCCPDGAHTRSTTNMLRFKGVYMYQEAPKPDRQ